MATSKRRKRVWFTIDEWREITRRCRAVRSKLIDLSRANPSLLGSSFALMDAFIRSESRFTFFLCELEDEIVAQDPRLFWDAIRFVHGGFVGRNPIQRPPGWSVQPWTDLERQEFERRLQELSDEIEGIALDLSRTKVSKALVSRLAKLSTFDRVRRELDRLPCHPPAWGKVIRRQPSLSSAFSRN